MSQDVGKDDVSGEVNPRRARKTPLPPPVSPPRGPLTPVQYEDDGWDDVPVQMRA